MPRSLILGSGPAAAAVAIALSEDPTQDIRVIDVGSRLEPALAATAERLAAADPARWSARDVADIATLPATTPLQGLPQKRSLGSDFPFRDFGQLAGVRAEGDVNDALVSGAFGGFSTVWGSQIMPFSEAAFRDWPLRRDDLEPHYRAVLSHIPYAGTEDDLAGKFPLFGRPKPLPSLAPRTRMTLDAYDRRQDRVKANGVTVGLARLALQSGGCVRCGLCMTGCPYGLIYSAGQTIDSLVTSGRLSYLPGLLAVRVGEVPEHGGEGAYVEAQELATGRIERFLADRVFVACGAVGSTRVAINSLRSYDTTVELAESAQFLMPALSRRPTSDPRKAEELTLNQFNVVIDDDCLPDVSQVHFYPYNDAIFAALPAMLRKRFAAPATTALLRRLSIGLGYLPSASSPRLRLAVRAPKHAAALPEVTVTGEQLGRHDSPAFDAVARRLLRVSRDLDLTPLLPLVEFSAPGKSYHWGGTFPHRANGEQAWNSTDLLGRPARWSRIHLVDGAVFPSVAATTFTLTVMANAHRIATEAMAL